MYRDFGVNPVNLTKPGEVLRLVPPYFPDVDLFKRTEFDLVHFTCCILGSCPEWS